MKKFSEMPENKKNNMKKENLLSSWKEIAAYLDCDIRTCHRWEKEYGLPIHRLSESSKARVFTSKEELDEWLQTRESNKADYDQGRFQFGPKIWSKTLSILVSLFVIAAACFVLIKPFQSKKSADFTIEGSILVVLNEKGKEVWRFDTELEKLVNEKIYRLHFQFKRSDGDKGRYLPHLIIKGISRESTGTQVTCSIMHSWISMRMGRKSSYSPVSIMNTRRAALSFLTTQN